MLTVRKSEERGHNRIDWLDSYHSFSFGNYYDEQWMGFRTLRVINDDIIAPGGGFGTHPHRDMEILTWVLEGSLQHQDSTGNSEVIRPGELQRMTAGRGILHSEFNASQTEPVRLLQIWILPERTGLQPGYEQTAFADEELRGKLRRIATRDGADGAVSLHQDVDLLAGRLSAGDAVSHTLAPGRHAWVQVATGSVTVNGTALSAGDAAAISEESAVELKATSPAEVLVFDLP